MLCKSQHLRGTGPKTFYNQREKMPVGQNTYDWLTQKDAKGNTKTLSPCFIQYNTVDYIFYIALCFGCYSKNCFSDCAHICFMHTESQSIFFHLAVTFSLSLNGSIWWEYKLTHRRTLLQKSTQTSKSKLIDLSTCTLSLFMSDCLINTHPSFPWDRKRW